MPGLHSRDATLGAEHLDPVVIYNVADGIRTDVCLNDNGG